MRFKMETDYAIRMVDYLVKRKKLARAPEISKEANVPLRFAKNILQKLTKEKIIISYQGVHGGYELGKDAEEISLYDVVQATSGPIKLNKCIMTGKECPCVSPMGCPYNKVFAEITQDMENKLKEARFG